MADASRLIGIPASAPPDHRFVAGKPQVAILEADMSGFLNEGMEVREAVGRRLPKVRDDGGGTRKDVVEAFGAP